MKSTLLFIIGFFFLHSVLSAQEFKDCSNPLLLCGESPFTIDIIEGQGIDDQLNTTCLADEINSTWIELNIEEAGSLVFELSITGNTGDLDFALFLVENGDCDNKQLVRCMASGETLGQDSEVCLGPTGLAFGETDIEELPGCSNESNNFLAPIEAMAGETYLLVVNEFTLSESNFQFSVGGSAVLGCIISSVDIIETSERVMTIFPTASSGVFNVVLNSSSSKELQIFNSVGQLIHKQVVRNYEFESVDLTHQEDGIYFFVYAERGKLYSEKVLLIR